MKQFENVSGAALAAHDATVAAGGWRHGGDCRVDGQEIVGHDWDNGPQAWDVVRDGGGQWWAFADPEFSARIVACVNACAGIADPAGLVRALRTIAGGNGSAAMVARAALGGDV